MTLCLVFLFRRFRWFRLFFFFAFMFFFLFTSHFGSICNPFSIINIKVWFGCSRSSRLQCKRATVDCKIKTKTVTHKKNINLVGVRVSHNIRTPFAQLRGCANFAHHSHTIRTPGAVVFRRPYLPRFSSKLYTV